MTSLETALEVNSEIKIKDGHVVITCCYEGNDRKDNLFYMNIGMVVGMLRGKDHFDITCDRCSKNYILSADYLHTAFQSTIMPHSL